MDCEWLLDVIGCGYDYAGVCVVCHAVFYCVVMQYARLYLLLLLCLVIFWCQLNSWRWLLMTYWCCWMWILLCGSMCCMLCSVLLCSNAICTSVLVAVVVSCRLMMSIKLCAHEAAWRVPWQARNSAVAVATPLIYILLLWCFTGIYF